MGSIGPVMRNPLMRADQGRYVDAEQLERQALAMRQKFTGEEGPDVAASLINLALVRSLQRDPASAETLLKQALEIRQKELSAGHPAIISTEVRLGEMLIDEGKIAEAETLLRKAVGDIHAVPFPLTSWQVAEAEIALGCALAKNAHSAEGERLLHDPEARLKGYPEAALHQQILHRAEASKKRLTS